MVRIPHLYPGSWLERRDCVGQIAGGVQDDQTSLFYPPDDIDALVSDCGQPLARPPLPRRLLQVAAKEIRKR